MLREMQSNVIINTGKEWRKKRFATLGQIRESGTQTHTLTHAQILSERREEKKIFFSVEQ